MVAVGDSVRSFPTQKGLIQDFMSAIFELIKCLFRSYLEDTQSQLQWEILERHVFFLLSQFVWSYRDKCIDVILAFKSVLNLYICIFCIRKVSDFDKDIQILC